MKRKLVLLISLSVLATSLNAEIASWYTAMEPGYFTESGTIFSDSLRGAASDTLAMGNQLGMLDTGIADLKVSIIREGTIRRDDSGSTGWYSFDLGVYDDTDALALSYKRLRENGLRPYIEIEDGGVHLYVRHIMAYQLDEAVDLIALSGIEAPEPIQEQNPYTR